MSSAGKTPGDHAKLGFEVGSVSARRHDLRSKSHACKGLQSDKGGCVQRNHAHAAAAAAAGQPPLAVRTTCRLACDAAACSAAHGRLCCVMCW